MTHFRQVHQKLRDTDTKIDELGYQSADAIVEQIVNQLRAVEENNSTVSLQNLTSPPRQ